MTIPAKAGPMTRLMLISALFAAAADEALPLGTSRERSPAKRGPECAETPYQKNEKQQRARRHSVKRDQRRKQRREGSSQDSRRRMKRRCHHVRRAPAGNRNRNRGKLLAT